MNKQCRRKLLQRQYVLCLIEYVNGDIYNIFPTQGGEPTGAQSTPRTRWLPSSQYDLGEEHAEET